MSLGYEIAGAFKGFNAQVAHRGLLALLGITRQQCFLRIAGGISVESGPLSRTQAFFGQLQQLEPALVPCLQGSQGSLQVRVGFLKLFLQCLALSKAGVIRQRSNSVLQRLGIFQTLRQRGTQRCALRFQFGEFGAEVD